MNKNIHKTSRFGLWLLSRFTNKKEEYGLFGDLEEMYQALVIESQFKATLFLWGQILRILPSIFIDRMYWSKIMFTNYVKVALRNIKRYKGYSFINIAGLAVGMACSILIFLWVLEIVRFDRFHDNLDNIYVVRRNSHYADGQIMTSTNMPGPLAPALQQNFPEIIKATRFFKPGEMLLSYGEKKFYETGVAGTDPLLFEIFTFPLIHGDPKLVLRDKYSIVISEEMVEKYFGEEDPIGKTININNRFDFIVTGIAEKVPTNSHITFDFLVPFEFLNEIQDLMDSWTFFRCNSYVLLQPGISYQDVSNKIASFLNDRADLEMKPELFLVPLANYFIFKEYRGVFAILVSLFSLVALLILIIACINFMNLATARSLNRFKEVGMRKIVGATRPQLFKQFMSESIIFAFISSIIAIFLVYFILPSFNNLIQFDLKFEIFNQYILIGLFAIVLFTGIVSGSYPALFLSSFRPIKVLKDTIATGVKRATFRKTLVIVQFSIAIILMVFSVFVFKQLKFVQTIDLGIDKKDIIYIPMKGEIQEIGESAKLELLQHPNIINVTMSHNIPTFIGGSGWYWSWPGKDPNQSVNVFETSVDFDFIETLNLEMEEGRFFAREFTSDLNNGVVINEKAVKVMDLDSPLGTKIKRFDVEYTVIGVVKNFNFLPIIEEIGPLTLRFRAYENRHMFVKIKSEQQSQTLSLLEKVIKKYNPNYPYEYKYYAEDVDILEKYMRPVSTIILIFTILAIFISCLGLFGLASFMTEKRTKEIGIKKVLGASISWIIVSLSKEFTICVLISNLIALPMAYLAVYLLLQAFAFRIDIDLLVFVVVGLFALMIAITTVSYQAIKAARTNPIKSLRYE